MSMVDRGCEVVIGYSDECYYCCFFFASRRRHTRCALDTGVRTCALPIWTDGVEPSGRFSPRDSGEWSGYEGGVIPPLVVKLQRVSIHQIGRASCRERACQYV